MRHSDVTLLATSVNLLCQILLLSKVSLHLTTEQVHKHNGDLRPKGRPLEDFKPLKVKLRKICFNISCYTENVLCLVSGCRTLTLERSNVQTHVGFGHEH